ncbi:MAG TPA: winged helix-turn-helix domain-containing protein [Micromonosporaceae bacterium]|nr:winged helix-turn-helix domain-containing protein [Micromonosporaceae bacterium]
MPKREADFRRIAREITEAIESGELASGSALPPVQKLAEQHGVSVSTVQRALTILEVQGLVEGHQGKAVYVRRER